MGVRVGEGLGGGRDGKGRATGGGERVVRVYREGRGGIGRDWEGIGEEEGTWGREGNPDIQRKEKTERLIKKNDYDSHKIIPNYSTW